MIQPWTEEQNDLLKRLWAAGASAGQIAAQPEFAGRDSPYCGEHHAMCYERWAGAKPSRLTPGRIGAK